MGSLSLDDDEYITRHLSELRWFRHLTPEQLGTLYGRARHRGFARYSTVIREGTKGAAFYLILRGRVRIVSEQHGISFDLPDANVRERTEAHYM